MTKMRKFASLILAMVMVMAMATVVSAAGNATITIQNAAKGETYKIVKLFDADATGSEGGSIAYMGNVPDSLTTYFVKDSAGNISATEAAKTGTELSEAAIAAMKAWAETQTEGVVEKVGEGSVVVFTGLEYGYYIVLTTQGTAITVTSTNPNATVYDKNTKEVKIEKSVDDSDVYIGQTVTYKVEYPTVNYLGTGKDAKKVVKYEITDTLPEFLSDVTVTGISVGDTTLAIQQFDEKKIAIDWLDNDGNSLYANGAKVTITYTAVVTDAAVIDGNGNTNTVTLQPYVEDGDDEGDDPDLWNETWTDTETIYTYAAALKKVDENNQPLAGAKFAANGLNVTGKNGNYTVTSYDASSTAPGTEMVTDDKGNLIIKGLPSDATLTVIETEAPAGYNKLIDSEMLTPTIINRAVTATTTTVYYDADGNVVDQESASVSSKTTVTYPDELEAAAIVIENRKGSILPSTGGIGTTIFYIVGSVLMVGAVVLLVTKKRMNTAN